MQVGGAAEVRPRSEITTCADRCGCATRVGVCDTVTEDATGELHL
jgi:hypothetical protein